MCFVFYKSHYLNVVVPKVQQLKFDYFGHDLVILHEHEIRKEKRAILIFFALVNKRDIHGQAIADYARE